MSDKEKLERMKKLADGMYYAAQYLTTDASGLRKAMEEYHRFIITEYNKQELASEDLEKASKEWLIPRLDKSYADYGERKMMELTHFDGYAMLDAVEFGAQWQKEQMMKDAVEIKINRDTLYDLKPLIHERYLDYKIGQKVKIIILPSDNK